MKEFLTVPDITCKKSRYAVKDTRVVFLFGPTAVGKTELACVLAEHIGEIISVDSMQVYRGMDLGTAKPNEEQRRMVMHHLIDLVPPDSRFSAGDFRRCALEAMKEIRERGKVPFFVGGTGLYFRALEYELLDAPPGDQKLRHLLYRMEEESPGILYETLKSMDPETADRIHQNDVVRLVRALEVYQSAGRRFSDFLRIHKRRVLTPLKIGLTLGREELYRRIEARCRRMIVSGLAEEVADLIGKGYTEAYPSMKGLGYSHYTHYFKGCLSHEETVRQFIRDTKRYAKRQLTWFRRETDAFWYEPRQIEAIRVRVLRFIEESTAP